MSKNNRILWITRTAAFIALLIVIQATTASLGNTLITGSMVNLLLIVAVMLCGLASGVTVAMLSPVLAKLIGIGPLWSLIPFIAVGNGVLVWLWHRIGKRKKGHPYVAHGIALVVAAFAKYLVLYVSIVKIAIPLFLGLPEKQAAIITHMFSIPQLFTALIGGVLALSLLPVLTKAFRGR